MAVNPIPSRREGSDWTPNQVAKREKIIRVTAALMAREGLGACTTRTIAAKGEVSASALHYYFADTDEIIDLAFRHIGRRFWNGVRSAGQAEADPVSAIWAAATAYLSGTIVTGDDFGKTPSLWFEYEAASQRLGSIDTVRDLSQEGASIFSELLQRVVSQNGESVARVFYASLLGLALRDKFNPRPILDILQELSEVLHLPAPAHAPAPAPAPAPAAARGAGLQAASAPENS